MNMHYMFHTDAAIIKQLNVTDHEKDLYGEHLKQTSHKGGKSMKYLDFLLKIREEQN